MLIVNLLLLFISLIVILRLIKSTNNSIINPGPFWKIILLEVFLIIFAPIFLMTIPSTAVVYQMQGTSISGIEKNSIIFYAQFILLVIGFNYGINKRKYYNKYSFIENINLKNSSLISLTLVFIALMAIILFHVSKIPILSFIYGESSAVIRANAGKELSGIYSIIHTLTITLSWLLIYVSASLKTNKKHYIAFLLLGLLGLIWFGHKSSIIVAMLGFYFYTVKNKPFSWMNVLKLFIYISVLLGILIIIYYNVIENKKMFVEEFLNRLFIGQLHGFYQEFEYFLSERDYWKSWLPLSSFIYGESYNYAADLMVFTEGESLTNQMKNTFLGAEAHRVLGLSLSIIFMFFIGYLIPKCIFWTVDFSTKLLGENFRSPLLWTLCSTLTITNGVYIYASFRFIYIFLVAMAPVILLKLLLTRKKQRKHE